MSRYRHEYKYIIDNWEKSLLLLKSEGILQRDPHVNKDGIYVIRSLYFDDINDKCFYENMAGIDDRSKFRIRYYNDSCNVIRLEKKSKLRGMTLKESCILSEEECKKIIRGEYVTSYDDEEKKKLLAELDIRGMKPKVIVTYERIPFIYQGGNVRITFDNNISASTEVDSFLSGDYRQRPIIKDWQTILEVKWDEILPLHIKNALQLDTLRWTSFSKYYMCRTNCL